MKAKDDVGAIVRKAEPMEEGTHDEDKDKIEADLSSLVSSL